jgi:hypothetical protein
VVEDLDVGDACKTHHGVSQFLNESIGDGIKDKILDVGFDNGADFK